MKSLLTEIDFETLPYEIIRDQYYFFKNNSEMQNMILWELNENKSFLKEIADYKEKITADLFRMVDPVFENSGISIRAVNAILVAAVYYLVIHAKNNGSTICQIDINTEEGEAELLRTIKQILNWTYEKALHPSE